MNLSDIIHRDLVVPEMNASDRWQAIEELVDILAKSGRIQSEEKGRVMEVLQAREKTMSTGIGMGIGIPHGSTNAISEVVGVLGRSKRGINFDALDNQPVNIVFLFLVPQGQFQKHLHTLARIAKFLHDKTYRQKIEQAPDADTIYEIVRSLNE